MARPAATRIELFDAAGALPEEQRIINIDAAAFRAILPIPDAEGRERTSAYNVTMVMKSSRVVDRSAFRVIDWDDHVADHDAGLREYWLSQPVAARLAEAMRCRRRVHGPFRSGDRTSFRVIDLIELSE